MSAIIFSIFSPLLAITGLLIIRIMWAPILIDPVWLSRSSYLSSMMIGEITLSWQQNNKLVLQCKYRKRITVSISGSPLQWMKMQQLTINVHSDSIRDVWQLIQSLKKKIEKTSLINKEDTSQFENIVTNCKHYSDTISDLYLSYKQNNTSDYYLSMLKRGHNIQIIGSYKQYSFGGIWNLHNDSWKLESPTIKIKAHGVGYKSMFINYNGRDIKLTKSKGTSDKIDWQLSDKVKGQFFYKFLTNGLRITGNNIINDSSLWPKLDKDIDIVAGKEVVVDNIDILFNWEKQVLTGQVKGYFRDFILDLKDKGILRLNSINGNWVYTIDNKLLHITKINGRLESDVYLRAEVVANSKTDDIAITIDTEGNAATLLNNLKTWLAINDLKMLKWQDCKKHDSHIKIGIINDKLKHLTVTGKIPQAKLRIVRGSHFANPAQLNDIKVSIANNNLDIFGESKFKLNDMLIKKFSWKQTSLIDPDKKSRDSINIDKNIKNQGIITLVGDLGNNTPLHISTQILRSKVRAWGRIGKLKLTEIIISFADDETIDWNLNYALAQYDNWKLFSNDNKESLSAFFVIYQQDIKNHNHQNNHQNKIGSIKYSNNKGGKPKFIISLSELDITSFISENFKGAKGFFDPNKYNIPYGEYHFTYNMLKYKNNIISNNFNGLLSYKKPQDWFIKIETKPIGTDKTSTVVYKASGNVNAELHDIILILQQLNLLKLSKNKEKKPSHSLGIINCNRNSDGSYNCGYSVQGIPLIKAGFFSNLVNLLTPVGWGAIFANANKDTISKLDGEFKLHSDYNTITLYNSRASLHEVSCIFDGTIFIDKRILDIKGTVTSMNTLNSILSVTPLRLWSGSYGILSTSFTVTGKIDKPEISVNPIGWLAPNFLRYSYDNKSNNKTTLIEKNQPNDENDKKPKTEP